MVAYTYQMPSGIPGQVTRPEIVTVEQFVLDQTTPPTVFGVPVKVVSAKIQPVALNDVATSFIGFLVRPYPTSGNGTDGLGAASPNKALPGDVLRRGYMSVVCNGSTVPASQGAVYVRVANPVTGQPIGGIEAALDTTIASTPGGGNVGTSTVGTTSVTPNTPAGTYTVTLTATGSTAAFKVTEANGDIIGAGNVGTQITLDNGLSFKITAGGTPTSGDTYAIAVSFNTVKLSGNTYFTGGRDANNNAEIAYNI